MKKDVQNLIPIVAIVLSLFSLVFSGLTYFSSEASKRADLNVFVNKKTVNLSYETSNDKLYGLITFKVEGVVTNEGPRSFQIDSFNFFIALTVPESVLKNLTTTNAAYTGFKKSCVSPDGTMFDWFNRLFDSGEKRSFAFSYTIKVDGEYVQNLTFSDCRIKAVYYDGISSQAKDVPIYGDWATSVSVGSSGKIGD